MPPRTDCTYLPKGQLARRYLAQFASRVGASVVRGAVISPWGIAAGIEP
ncbi:MAG: hypothetical protein ACRDH2_08145 [Anaerolineales bacterium]